MKRCIFTLLIILSALPSAGAIGRPTLAVLPFKPLAKVSPSLSAELTGYFTAEVVAMEYFNVIDRTEIDQLFNLKKDSYCGDKSSAVKRGKALQADMVIFGLVRREGDAFIINSTLIRVSDGTVINTGTTVASGETRGMRVKGAELAALDLVENLALAPAAAHTPPPVPPVSTGITSSPLKPSAITPEPEPEPRKTPGQLLYTAPPAEERSESPVESAPAPTRFTPEVRVGLKAVLALAVMYGGSSSDWDGRTGGTFGVFLRWLVSESFTIQPEIIYTMKGVEYSEDYQGSSLKITLEMNYLEIPILAKYALPVEWAVKPHIFAGPYLGIKIGDDLKASYKGQSTSIPESVADLKDYEFGFALGVGFDYFLGTSGLINLDIRYGPALTGAFGGGDEKNSVWAVTVGYVF